MSVSKSPGGVFEAVTARHRLLVAAGVVSSLVGLALATYVGYEWFVRDVSHQIYALLSGVALLFGVQLLVLASLTSMLMALHEEVLRQIE